MTDITDRPSRAAAAERRGRPPTRRDVAAPEVGRGRMLVATGARGVRHADLDVQRPAAIGGGGEAASPAVADCVGS